MNTHEIIWTHEINTTTAQLVCNDPDCQYRWECSEDCEEIYDVVAHGDGYRHRSEDDWHHMKKQNYCNFVEWMDADPDVISELNDGGETFEIGRVPVEPIWQGDEGALWRRIASAKPEASA
jgi:hypothetical protein